MRRLHAAKDDLDWLPKKYRLLRGAVIGSVWSAIGGGVAALMFFGPHVYFLAGKAIFAIGAGGYWLGDRVSKGIVTSRLGKLASGKVDLARLSNSEDGDLVHVRGIVRATETVPSLFGHAPGVYHRVRASFHEYVAIEETAVDFRLVDAEGNAIIVEVENARWLLNDAKMEKVVEEEKLASFGELADVAKYLERSRNWSLKKKRAPRFVARATEAMLRDGDEVEVVGYKSRTLDQSVGNRMARETPMRATLRGGKELPVMISRVQVVR